MSATEQAFPPTEVEVIEVKTLPAATLIRSAGAENYFRANGQLFQPLFRYISRHDIAMTTPVEAHIEPGEMLFYIGSDAASRPLPAERGVEIVEYPERQVVSIGLRGGYSEKQFEEGKAALEAWLAQQSDWRALGEARAVYWHGPMTPWFMRRAEVHLSVERIPRT